MSFNLSSNRLNHLVPFIEKYLLSENKDQFIQALPDQGQEKKLLKAITGKSEFQQYARQIRDIGMNSSEDQAWIKLKAFQYLLDVNASRQNVGRSIDFMKQTQNFRFEYSKPINRAKFGAFQKLEQKQKIILKAQNYSLSQFLQKNKNNDNIYNELTQEGIYALGIDQILKVQKKNLGDIINKINLADHGDKSLELLKIYHGKNKKKDKNYELPKNFYDKLTAEQLQKLPQYLPDVTNQNQYISILYKKSLGYQIKSKFILSNQLYSKEELKIKKQLLYKSIEWLKQWKVKEIYSFHDQLLLEIISINILIEEPDLQILFEYLQRPREVINEFKVAYQNKLLPSRKAYKYNYFWQNSHGFSTSLWGNDSNLFRKYLKTYFKLHSDLQEANKFTGYFQLSFINTLLYKVKLQKGESIEDLSVVFKKSQISEFRDKKILFLSQKNKQKFKINEPVSIIITTKNIDNIVAEIYEISSEKHFLNSSSQIDSYISLDYLEPLKKVHKKIQNDNTFKVTDIQFDLTEHLGNRNSIFVVNFQSQGFLSRAVIKRGSIICLKQTNIVGYQLRFYDEDGTAIEELDLWIRGRKVHVSGKYTIPYGQSHQQLKLIAVKDDYAELINVTIQQEDYNWNVNYIYHQENFLVGSKAKILITAQLSSNTGVVDVQALKDTTILVNILNHLGVPSSLQFTGIKWNNKSEYELQIPIQSYLRQIRINISAKVDKYVGKSKQLYSDRTINFKQDNNVSNFVQFFLSSTSSGFFVNLLGKSGEPKSFINVTVQIRSRLFSRSLTFNLLTDQNGQINLGNLDQINYLSVRSEAVGNIAAASAFWNFNFNANEVDYPSSITQNEEQELNLPIYSNFKLQTEVSLHQMNITDTNQVISDQTHRLKLDDNRLHCKLPKGSYVLNFLSLNQRIKIFVIKLQKWGNSNQLIDKETNIIHKLPSQIQDPVFLSDKFQKEELQNDYKIKLQLKVKDQKSLENVRVHVIADTFFYRNNYSSSLSNLAVGNRPDNTTLRIKNKLCSYLNKKELSDEHCYIINRQSQEKFIGNFLERPRVLLKRLFNKNTTFNQQNLAQQTSFQKNASNDMYQSARNLYGKNHQSSVGYRRKNIQNSKQFTLFNNFLKNPSKILANQQGQTIQFTIPKIYQSFIVIVASPHFAFERLYNFAPTKYQINNLTNTGLEDEDPKQAFTISRESYKLNKRQKLSVSRLSQWTTVSGNNLNALAQISNQKTFDWVSSWLNYTDKKKLKVYDEQVCHQLNTFIKYKDPVFFNTVVKQFISNKLEKGIVDYCLLQDKKAQIYANSKNYSRLNYFEKCLLIEYLNKNGQEEKAKSMAESLALKYKALRVPQSQFENKFDIIMTSKQMAVALQRQPKSNNQFHSLDKAQKKKVKQTNMQKYKNEQSRPVFKGEQREQIEQCLQIQDECQESYRPIQKSMKRKQPMRIMENLSSSRNRIHQRNDSFENLIKERSKFKAGFQEVQNAKQYVETTYYEMKDPSLSTNYIGFNKFWVDLAEYFANPVKQFVTQSFIYLTSKPELSLAAAFLPMPFTPDYSIKTEGQNIIITAQSPFVVFVKAIKPMQYNSKYGIIINQRISDPNDQFQYEQDGTKLEKKVEEYIKDKPYYLHSVITNTSPANLQLRVLTDIPQGSVPLGSNEYIQVINMSIGSYQTKSVKKAFYFPQAGEFTVYPANACKNKQVISKAGILDTIVVKDAKTIKKLQTLDEVLVQGTVEDSLNFIKTKNIFDSQVFTQSSILWLLKQKKNYEQISKIFKDRSYYSENILQFGFLHNDSKAMREYAEGNLSIAHLSQRVFQYFPLSSIRAHKFMKSEKSTILNQTFKETYSRFLISSLALKTTQTPLFLIVFTYYLILQDRTKDAHQIFQSLSKYKNEAGFPRLQYDYVACFLDIYVGYPNFVVAREISSVYVQKTNIIESWKKLFRQVYNLLNEHDVAIYDEDIIQEHDIKVTIKGDQLSVFLPQKTSVQINLHAVNLELLFSNSPFEEANLFSTIKPFKCIVVSSEKGGETLIDKPQGYFSLYVHAVEITSTKQAQIIQPFLWSSTSVKAKILQNQGVAIVFVDGKPQPGVYCKVYASGNNGRNRFYRDGYTDIQGRFKYVYELDDVSRFAILFITQKGGIRKFARKPTKNGYIE